jgi:hypothetical protein
MKHHSQSFAVGMKIEVKIPITNAKKFIDWAVINEIEGNQIVAQLSRSVLPEGVILRVGQVIECRNLDDRKGSSYQAIVVSKGVLQELRLNLFHEISSSDRREFFRIDAFLPFKCHINTNKRTYSVLKQWKVQLKQLKAEEDSYKKSILKESSQKQFLTNGTETAVQADSDKKRRSDFVPYDPSWDNIMPQAVNISGGGISLFTNHPFDINEFVLLEIFIPSRNRALAIVAQVQFVHRNCTAGTDQDFFNTGMQFIFIDEQDRSAIVHYISLLQSKRLRQMNDHADMPLYNDSEDSQSDKYFDLNSDYSVIKRVKSSTPLNWLGLLIVIVTFIVSCLCFTVLLRLVSSYSELSNEIGENIGGNVGKFRSTFQKGQ